MKIQWNSKYTTISAYTVITVTICVLVFMAINKLSVLWSGVQTIIGVLMPIIWGFAIAYLLNPFMKMVERLLKKALEKKKPRPKLCRGLATAAAVIFGLAVISAVIAIIVPQLIRSIITIFSNFPSYMDNIYEWANAKLEKYPQIQVYVNEQLDSVESKIIEAINGFMPKLSDVILQLKDSAFGVIGNIGDFVIGFIVAVYFLIDKEHFAAQVKKMLAAFCPENAYNSILKISARTNAQVVNFLSGKIIDSVIIGFLCFFAMKIIGLEYATLISTIVGITNIIPFFGPFIGAIPSALLLLVSYPDQFLPFIILVVVLQQLDGNIIGPQILGDQTGLSPFWIMFAIFVGGGLFKFAGMILGVPIFAVLYELFDEFVNYRLEKKGMSPVTDDYRPMPEDTETPKKPIKFFGITFSKDMFKKKKAVESEDNN